MTDSLGPSMSLQPVPQGRKMAVTMPLIKHFRLPVSRHSDNQRRASAVQSIIQESRVWNQVKGVDIQPTAGSTVSRLRHPYKLQYSGL